MYDFEERKVQDVVDVIGSGGWKTGWWRYDKERDMRRSQDCKNER